MGEKASTPGSGEIGVFTQVGGAQEDSLKMSVEASVLIALFAEVSGLSMLLSVYPHK